MKKSLTEPSTRDSRRSQGLAVETGLQAGHGSYYHHRHHRPYHHRRHRSIYHW